MSALRLYLIVFIAGASVLALEILGTRVLGPFYGVSLFLWSALITVTLAALSVGYAIGGRWADRRATPGRLGALVGGAGVWVLAIPWLKYAVLRAAEPLGLRAAVLLTAGLLFAPPLTLLGMVSPLAIRLKARAIEHVGRTAGDLWAISTVASVLAALAVGFFLIPSMGVSRLTAAVGVALLVAAAVALFGRGTPRVTRVAGGIVLLAGTAATAALPRESARPEAGLMELRHSAYGEIRVLDARGVRHLLIDGGIHSIVDPATYRSWHNYVAAMELLKLARDEPGRLLLIGLGGGAIAKSFATDGWEVTAAEIDPVIVDVAREWFGLTESECAVRVRDGRRFLLETEDRWDVIVVDAFGSSSVPFHLATVECFGLLADRLRPGGVVAMNVETLGWNDPLVASLAASLAPWFEHVVALPTVEPPDAVGNVVVVGSFEPFEFDEFTKLARPFELLDRPQEHFRAVQMNHAWDNRFVPETTSAVVLTDDRNPSDLWSDRVNRVVRRDLHEYFAGHGPAW